MRDPKPRRFFCWRLDSEKSAVVVARSRESALKTFLSYLETDPLEHFQVRVVEFLDVTEGTHAAGVWDVDSVIRVFVAVHPTASN